MKCLPTVAAGPLGRGWQWIIALKDLLNGDRAYAHYLAHWRAHHDAGDAPLGRSAFHREEMQRRWNGVRRCC